MQKPLSAILNVLLEWYFTY